EASASSSITESTNFCGKNYCGTCPQAMHGIPNKDPGTHRCTGHKCNICKKEASASSTPVTLDKITCDFCEKTNLYDRIDDPLICKNCGEALEEFKRLMEKDNAMDERKQAKQTECQHPEEECYFCGHTCTLREEGDSASSPTSEHNFEWEAELDCLMAPPEQPQESSNSCYYDPRYYLIAPPEQPQEERQPSPSSEKEVTFLSYKSFDFKKRKPIEEVVTVVKMERKEFPEKTIFPPEFPAPVVCQEFCDKTARCHLRQNGIGDLCKSSNKFGKLVHRVDLKWSAWHDFRTRLPKTDMVHSSRTHGDVPEVALAHWGSPDAPMNDNGANGNDEYASPTQQAREFGDRDAVGFVPAFIFGPGKPEWRSIIVSPKNGIPYTKLVKYPSIRAIACKVELRNGYVVPVGKFGSVLKITTRADKKRMRAYTAIKKELTQYVGAERAAKMAGREVAAMATC
ncbi:MAG: hypothetical protein Q8L87_19010, partial [Anaerolineales bacterium]|nr:hypothetical protein [Anaerolineales bacterium]